MAAKQLEAIILIIQAAFLGLVYNINYPKQSLGFKMNTAHSVDTAIQFIVTHIMELSSVTGDSVQVKLFNHSLFITVTLYAQFIALLRCDYQEICLFFQTRVISAPLFILS